MNVHARKKRYWLLILLVPATLVLAAIALQRSHVKVIPDPPKGATAPLELPATTCHLSVATSAPKSAITSELEKAIPKTFPFDINRDGTRVYGTASRGPINITIEVRRQRPGRAPGALRRDDQWMKCMN
jgi:hypothetical protein